MLHAGFLYKPGSLKAQCAVEGNAEFDQVSRELDVPFKRTGKLIVGFTDMFTPSVIAAESVTSDMSRFIVAVISVTQLIYLSEVGGLILGSKIPVNLLELFVLFLERTIISLFIVAPLAHLIF